MFWVIVANGWILRLMHEIVDLYNLLCYSNIVVPDRIYGGSKVYIRPIMLHLDKHIFINAYFSFLG
jgi:hypothetical protein